MKEFEDLELIEAYFEDRLSPEAKGAFELKYAQDPDFRITVDTYRKAISSMSAERDPTREEIRETLSTPINTHSASIRSNTYVFATALAAAAVLILVFIWSDRMQSETLNYPELAEEFNIKEPGIPVLMGTDTGTLRQSMISFQSGDFSLSIKQLHQLPESDTTLYFLGVAEYELGQYEQAAHLFDLVIQQESNFLPDAHYRRALSALSMNDRERALEELQELLTLPSSSYHLLADSLIHKIQRQ